ncbi:DUF4911 domain-containing protein [bacterium]|nr:MAG: DUF4911 domain-containing protein [bacterium]
MNLTDKDITAKAPSEIWVLCRVPREEIFFLRYILDAYDGLAVSTTLPGGEGLVRIYTEMSRKEELDKLLEALGEEFSVEIADRGIW